MTELFTTNQQTSEGTIPMVRLGVVTIGQTPRVDLTPELQALLPGVELVERGVLDGLTREEIASFAPEGDDDVLTSRLTDGSAVIMGESHVLRRLPSVIADLEGEVDAVFLACTGRFPELAHTKPLFVPDFLIAYGTAALAQEMTAIGVICPLPEQAGFTVEKFAPRLNAGTEVLVAAASPYTGTEEELAAAAKSLQDRGAGIIALDCMGYTEAMRTRVANASGLPVVLARSVAARIAAEVLDSLPSRDSR
jgi:protein AroM